jgi:hypothetical protein
MTFFYNSHTGGYANESPPSPQYLTYETQLHLGQGWHAYGSMQAMLADIQRNHWPQPNAGKGLLSPTSTAPDSVKQAVSNAANLGGIQAIGDFFNRLTQANTWIRVGEVLAGLLLLYLGLNAAMKNTAVGNTVQSTTKHVKSAGKAVIPRP